MHVIGSDGNDVVEDNDDADVIIKNENDIVKRLMTWILSEEIEKL